MTASRVWRRPPVLAALALFGLLPVLPGEDGHWRWLSRFALAAPLPVIFHCLSRSPARRPGAR